MELLPAILFAILTIIIMIPIFPLTWAIIAFMALLQLDLSGYSFASATSLGIENTIKSIILPLFLLFRTDLTITKKVIKTPLFILWFLFVLYAGITATWSPFPLSALKQVAYFATYTLTFFIFLNIYKSKGPRYFSSVIFKSLFVSIMIAVLQTFLAGNPYGRIDNRFTSFASPQSFGLYLTFMAIVLLLLPSRTKTFSFIRIGSLALIFIAVFLSGSRTGLLTTGMIVSSAIFVWSFARGRKIWLVGLLFLLNVAFLISIIVYSTPSLSAEIIKGLTQQRSLQTLIVFQDQSLNDISTFRYRTEIIRASLQILKSNGIREIILGNGTSSIAEVVTQGYVYYRGYTASNIDANRIAHNEFIRTFYEWGIIGAFFMFIFLGYLLLCTVRGLFKLKNAQGVVILFSFIYILIVLSTSNLFAAASAPAGLGFILYLIQLGGTSRKQNYADHEK